MLEFEIETKPWGCAKVYRKKHVAIKPGITILVGCNGSGKSTMLSHIECHLQKQKACYLSYNNLLDGGNNAMGLALEYDIHLLATLATSSEGEQITINLRRLALGARKLLEKNPSTDTYYILIDSVDSGLSVDSIIDFKKFLNVVLEDFRAKGKELYIIVTANAYEMTCDEQCFSVQDVIYTEFKNYEEYRYFILRTRKLKDQWGEAYDSKIEHQKQHSKSSSNARTRR